MAAAPKQTRYQEIREWLLNEMQSYDMGAQLPSDRQLAKDLHAALLTVKRVMGDLEREGYVARRQGKGTFLVSRETPVQSKNLQANVNGKVIFAYPNYYSWEYWKRAYVAEEIALKNEMGLLECKMHPYTTYKSVLDLVKSRDDVRGVLIDPVPGSITRAVFDEFDALGIPIILFSATEFLPLSQNICSSIPDWFKLGYLRTHYLTERGHRAIGLINNEPEGQDQGQTIKGTKHALREAGIGFRELKRIASSTRAWESSIDAGYQLMKQLLDEHTVSVVMFDSIAGALGGLRTCWERRIRIPDQLSIITNGEWDGNEAYFSPPLTTLRFDIYGQVKQAFDIILGREKLTAKTVQAEILLSERESVADLRKA